jgi:hypothetical protein
MSWQTVGQLGMHAGVRDKPAAHGGRRVRPATACQRRQRGAVCGSLLGKHLHLVVARQHHIENSYGQAGRVEVGLRRGAAVKEVADLNDPKAASATSPRVEHAECSQQRAQQIGARMHIPNDDFNHACRRCLRKRPPV